MKYLNTRLHRWVGDICIFARCWAVSRDLPAHSSNTRHVVVGWGPKIKTHQAEKASRNLWFVVRISVCPSTVILCPLLHSLPARPPTFPLPPHSPLHLIITSQPTMSDTEYAIESADAGASATIPMEAGQIKKGG